MGKNVLIDMFVPLGDRAMKCIFCLQEKEPSNEHVIPDSIGGTIRIKEVCRNCNSELSRQVDDPFSKNPLIQLARYCHSLGGKRDIIPFPFRHLTSEAGEKISLDEELNPHLERILEIKRLAGEQLQVFFSADYSDADKFEQMIRRPLEKALEAEFPTWSTDQREKAIRSIIEYARALARIIHEF